ncbi:O-fucosyltransferase family protein [Zea mays]|uniref:O-fucosyltransferase family protein n=1 Tax=Zea mays TaxID=4577 RepID=A0A1D6KNC6_MAIZE|nr:O-fucosyltransferase family protein [Zea mays]
MLLLFRTEGRLGCNVSHVNTYSGIAEKSMDKFAALISSFRYPGPRASGLHAPLKDVKNTLSVRSILKAPEKGTFRHTAKKTVRHREGEVSGREEKSIESRKLIFTRAKQYAEEYDALPISFDKVFDFNKFNARCHGFGTGRRWTADRDLDQLQQSIGSNADDSEVIEIVGENPFLWPDHWPVKDYAKIFDCLVLVPEIETEVVKVISKIREAGQRARHEAGGSHSKQRRDSSTNPPVSYVAVHMRVEKDWMIHCKKWEQRSKSHEICSSKEEIIHKVSQITDLRRPVVVYLAVADSLLEDDSITSGWRVGMVAYEKKKLGVTDIYDRQPYLIKSAIDFEVCSRADVFVGNSFSTFSNLVVLSRTERLYNLGKASLCGENIGLSSYAYNVMGDDDAAQPAKGTADPVNPSPKKCKGFLSFGFSWTKSWSRRGATSSSENFGKTLSAALTGSAQGNNRGGGNEHQGCQDPAAHCLHLHRRSNTPGVSASPSGPGALRPQLISVQMQSVSVAGVEDVAESTASVSPREKRRRSLQ